jgi:hypothetical protein
LGGNHRYDALCGVLDREEYDEYELYYKIEGTTFDDKHHRTMGGALADDYR